jgi:hypothetical protein
MGDCGAFTYVRDEAPPYSVEDLIDFYDGCAFDIGLSLDHVILGYLGSASDARHAEPPPSEWVERRDLTIQLAAEFWRRRRARDCTFIPMGVAQGWSPKSYARSVRDLQRIGYRRIALGGMVSLKTPEILESLQAVSDVRRPETEFHLLGITRCEQVSAFAEFGVTSFDSTSPFRQAFKDERDNYYTLSSTFTAVRVPQVDGNPSMKRLIQAGRINQRRAFAAERACLNLLDAYDSGRAKLEPVLDALCTYERLHDPEHDHTDVYRRTLQAMPWKRCRCRVCRTAGVHVILFRGAERNKRRGFHNIYMYRQRLDRQLRRAGSSPPPRAQVASCLHTPSQEMTTDG